MVSPIFTPITHLGYSQQFFFLLQLIPPFLAHLPTNHDSYKTGFVELCVQFNCRMLL
uniref:Uncharacterized protein n=1 Tax=Helianthus annuus TaxID=4232 RepID=A0A251TPF0_HELAN